jgi:hypothetical protein
MQELTPSQAASIASNVYGLRERSVSQNYERGAKLGCEDMFVVNDNSRFQGKTGALCFKPLSGFGYIAEGKGKYQGEILIVTRGTDANYDWVTNFNIGMQIGPSSHLVHAGFHETWKSFSKDIQAFIKGRNPSGIHCVGHSLGGALATLNADYFLANKVGQVKLYTFGSPRTGSFIFSRSLTKRLGLDNVYRVWHPSDPVPMIPIFPFQHLPHNTKGLSIHNGFSGLINKDAHNMEKSYCPAVEHLNWQHLASNANANEEAEVKSWLEHAAQNQNGFIQGSAKLLSMIQRALMWILKKAGQLLVGAVGTVLTVGVSVLDQLAWMLSRATHFSIEFAGFVSVLVQAIFKFLGKTISTTTSITAMFLRWVLDLLFSNISAVAVNAVARIR